MPRIIPPHNDFGKEEDSLNNVVHLVYEYKRPYQNFYKLNDNQTILRFKAKLKTKIEEDMVREFIITFFCCDDSLQIFDMPKRNSGFIPGKFLERARYRNKNRNQDYFKATDFIIGDDVIINSYVFKIIDGDEGTKRWQKEHIVF